jgi:cellulose synthase (UDP-forming)
LLGAFVALRLFERKSEPIKDIPPSKLPSVDVYIPTYSEPVEIVKPTVLMASMLDYPREKFNVYILDDGGTAQKTYIPSIDEIEKVKKEYEELKKEYEKLNEDKKFKLSSDGKKLYEKLLQKEKEYKKLLQQCEKGKEARKRQAELQKIADEAGINVHYLTREKNEHAKAGNINEALKKTKGDLILILDCDHVPTQNFLKETVGFFVKNPKLFLVQTPHKFYNQDPIEKNLRIFRQVPNESEMFYNFIQKGLDFWDSSFFCGSAAILRRKYLEEVGGIAGDTITEDAETALELHSKGYESAYYSKGMIFGLQPETFSSFIVQRSRWAQGMIQIFLLKNPLFKKGLKWYQRLGYLNSNLFWFFGIARVVFLIIPLFFIFFNLKIYDATLNDVLAYAMPHFFFSLLLSYYLYSEYRWPFFSEVYESIQSLFLLPAIISVIKNPRAPTFIVTPKGESFDKSFVSPFYKPIFILFNISVLAVIVGFYKFFSTPDVRGTLIILAFWMIFNVLYLSIGIIVSYEKPEKRVFHRIPANDEAVVYINDRAYEGVVRDVSLTGIWVEVKKDLTPVLKEYVWDKKLKFLIKDEYDNMIALQGEVVNANSHNIRMKFIYSNIEEEKKVIQVVYASSSRWKIFMDEKSVNPVASFAFLVKVTLKDFIVAYGEVAKQFVKDLSLITKVKGKA